MSRKEYLQMTYDNYFDRLERLADQVEKLKSLLDKVPQEQKELFSSYIASLEDELANYAEHISTSGVDVIRHVA